MFIVASSAVMVMHCIWFEQKRAVVRDFLGGSSILNLLYLNGYADCDSLICFYMITVWFVKYLR